MAKLSGINYQTAVPSLGQQSVSGPLGVANAQANTALKKASVAGQVAQNMANIGSIRQGVGDRQAASQLRQIDQQRVFAKDMRSLIGQGADLTVSIIKSNAARGLKDYQIGEAEDYQALLNSPASVEQPLDPNDPSLGTRSVSTHNEIMPLFQQQQASRKEAILANTTPLARPMMAQLIDEQQSKSVLKMRDAVMGKAKDFTAGEGVILIDEAIREKKFGEADKLRKSYRNVFSGAKNAQIVGIIERAKKEDEIDGKVFDSANRIISSKADFSSQMESAEKIRGKEERVGVVAIIQRRQRTADYTEQKRQQEQVKNNREWNLEQFKNNSPDEWIPSPNASIAQRNALESYRDKKIKGTPIKTNEVLYSKLQKMAYDPSTWEEFSKVDLQKDRDQFEDRHFERLDLLQAKNPNTSTSKTTKFSYSKASSIGNDVVTMMAPQKARRIKPETIESRERVKNLVWDQIQYKEDNGDKVTDDDVNKMYREISRKVAGESFLKLEEQDSDQFIESIIIDSGKYISVDSVKSERANFMEWANETNADLRKAGITEATPEELQQAYRDNRIKP